MINDYTSISGNGRISDRLLTFVESQLDRDRYQEQHWEGTFGEYLDLVQDQPAVIRNAYQRIYDMVLSHGWEKIRRFKADIVRYHFFSDPFEDGADGIGADRQAKEHAEPGPDQRNRPGQSPHGRGDTDRTMGRRLLAAPGSNGAPAVLMTTCSLRA